MKKFKSFISEATIPSIRIKTMKGILDLAKRELQRAIGASNPTKEIMSAIERVSAVYAMLDSVTESTVSIAEDKKPFSGVAEKYVYFVKIDSLERNDFATTPFGRQLDDLRKVTEWQKTAKSAYVSLKNSPSAWKSIVSKEISALGAKEWYVKFQQPSKFYYDDSVQIFYKK